MQNHAKALALFLKQIKDGIFYFKLQLHFYLYSEHNKTAN